MRKTFRYRTFVGTPLGVQITNGDDLAVLIARAGGAPCHVVETGSAEADYIAARMAAVADAEAAAACTGELSCECPPCVRAMEAEHAAECWAEGAWLRHAEQGYPGYADDPRELALEANDPQVNGDWMVA